MLERFQEKYSESKLSTAHQIYNDEGIQQLAREIKQYYSQRHGRIAQVKQSKSNLNDNDYNHSPELTFLIQSFNRKENIGHLNKNIPRDDKYELVILEDGSIDGSLTYWDEKLTDRNDFLIRSNDLHEIRTYTRGIEFTTSQYVCLLQDDDQVPPSDIWIHRTMELFDSIPDLGAVGGWFPGGLGVYDSDYNELSDKHSIAPVLDWKTRYDNSERNKEVFPLVDNKSEEKINTVEKQTNIPVVFVPWICVGPIFIDTDAFHSIGGFDLSFSEPGEPGIHFEADFCLRLWKSGYKVAYSNMGFYGSNGGGTEEFTPDKRQENLSKNINRSEQKHRDDLNRIERDICKANDKYITTCNNQNVIRPLIMN